jgi:hypothetical protein
MQVFELKRKLPSCKVDKELLVTLEQYLIEQAQQVFGLTEDAARSEYKLSIEDSFGTGTFSSAREFLNDKFPDTTSSVRIILRPWRSPHLTIIVYFHRESIHSAIEVIADGPQARERAIGCYDGILGLLDSRRTGAWFFHPPALVQGMLGGITLISLGALPWAFILKEPGVLSGALVAVPLILVTYHTGAYIKPYTAFVSRRTEFLEKTWTLFVVGMAGFILFGTLLPALLRKVLGF